MGYKIDHTVNLHWNEIKHAFLKAKSTGEWSSQPQLDQIAKEWHSSPDQGSEPGSWSGGSANQTEQWILHGYFADDFQHTIGQEHNIQTTSIVWNEEEGDPDITRIICGYDDIFLGALQAPSLSGIKIMIDLDFNAQVEAPVIREYGAFCASLINALMESGFDVEIDIRMDTAAMFTGYGGDDVTRKLIRVKEFGELLDFTSFSAAFGPTGMRHLNFTAIGLAGDRLSKVVSAGLGRAIGTAWEVVWDERNRVVELRCDSNTSGFPGSKMAEQAIEAGIM
jgi:hypothetical protein